MYNAAKIYESIGAQTNGVNASQEKCVQILMQHVMDKILKSKSAMVNKNLHDKGVSISQALTVLEALKCSLDNEKGGDIAKNLNDLYGYMINKLIEANLNNNIENLDEVFGLMSILKEGWDAVYQDKSNE